MALRSIASLVLLCIATAIHAQPCRGVQGIVRDAVTGEGLPGASIRVTGNLQAGAFAGTDGAFSLLASPGDSLIISFVSYETQVIVVGSCTVSVSLKSSVGNMDEIVVRGERLIAEEFTSRTIKKLEIYTNPSAKADPLLAVNSLPFATTTDESANISLRGGSPAETGIFLNNVPIQDAVRYSQLNGLGTFSIFNTALISQVQVFPGNPPLEYGNSTSGVIALQSDEEVKEHNTTTLSATLASLGFYHSRKSGARSSLTGFGNFQSSSLFNVMNKKSLGNLKGFSSFDIGLHYFKSFNTTTTLKIFNYTLNESYRYQYNHPTHQGVFGQGKTRNFTVANIRKRIGDLELSLNQGLSFSSGNYLFSTLDMTIGQQDYFVSFNIHHQKNNWEWKTGVTYDHKKATVSGTYPTYSYAYGESYPVSNSESSESLRVPEWYGYVKRYFGSRVVIGAGLRKNIPLTDQKNYLSWQTNMSYRPSPEWNINFSSGYYSKYLLPQGEFSTAMLIQSKQYSIDASFRKNAAEFSGSVFYKEVERGDTHENISGVELFGRYRVTSNLKMQWSLTSLNAEQQRENQTTPAPYDIHYFIRGNIEYKIQGTWTFTLVYLFRQGGFYYPLDHVIFHQPLQVYEPFYTTSPARLPAYSMIDFSASKIFILTKRSTAIIFVSTGNIPNFKNVRAYAYNVDYSSRYEETFSQRILYFGIIVNL